MLHSLENQADRIKNSGVCCLAKKRRKKSAWASDSDDESEWEKTPYMEGSDICEPTVGRLSPTPCSVKSRKRASPSRLLTDSKTLGCSAIELDREAGADWGRAMTWTVVKAGVAQGRMKVRFGCKAPGPPRHPLSGNIFLITPQGQSLMVSFRSSGGTACCPTASSSASPAIRSYSHSFYPYSPSDGPTTDATRS